jgi:hypothetical protein
VAIEIVHLDLICSFFHILGQFAGEDGATKSAFEKGEVKMGG